ncbi:RNA polymerase factor sigma-54 [Halobacillus sp. A5]|uniref:RNA polymerase factor sigma-54 n=1 Tax=Halobacillus sp. A5 TaxID=2880263 RepID=UPI0020A6D73D|nr:RNA polymerase factor sigma-54 [Halobacillus sp. A5]
MKLGLQQKQTTQLNMTKELRQAISLLQYSQQEIIEFINEQVMENPLLEMDTSRKSPSAHDYTVDQFPEAVKGWRQSLIEQAGVLPLTPSDRSCLKGFIERLDDQGFLPYNDEDLAELFQLQERKVKVLRKYLIELEPRGTGAYDFKDFLLLQIKEDDHKSRVTKLLIERYLPEVAAGHIEELAEKLSLNIKDVQSSIDYLKELQPRPLLAQLDPNSYIVPDFLLEYDSGSFKVTLNQLDEPSVYITPYNQKVDKEGEEFLKKCYQRASWLLRSIDNRKQTMLQVARAVLDKQTTYLEAEEKGPFAPLTLKQIAEETGMHESTVSRTLTDKFVKSPKGIFRLDQFFTSSLEGNGGTLVSSQYVKELIEKLIEEEDKRKPDSDQSIANELQQKYHIAVSRRTVTKYRVGLNIPSSFKRKLT